MVGVQILVPVKLAVITLPFLQHGNSSWWAFNSYQGKSILSWLILKLFVSKVFYRLASCQVSELLPQVSLVFLLSQPFSFSLPHTCVRMRPPDLHFSPICLSSLPLVFFHFSRIPLVPCLSSTGLASILVSMLFPSLPQRHLLSLYFLLLSSFLSLSFQYPLFSVPLATKQPSINHHLSINHKSTNYILVVVVILICFFLVKGLCLGVCDFMWRWSRRPTLAGRQSIWLKIILRKLKSVCSFLFVSSYFCVFVRVPMIFRTGFSLVSHVSNRSMLLQILLWHCFSFAWFHLSAPVLETQRIAAAGCWMSWNWSTSLCQDRFSGMIRNLPIHTMPTIEYRIRGDRWEVQALTMGTQDSQTKP